MIITTRIISRSKWYDNNNNIDNDNNSGIDNNKNNNNNYIIIMIAIMIIIIMIIKKIIIRIKRMKTTNVNFKLFPSFLFICKKYFTKCSCLVCLTHLSDIKSNWRPDIQLVYPVQFLLS